MPRFDCRVASSSVVLLRTITIALFCVVAFAPAESHAQRRRAPRRGAAAAPRNPAGCVTGRAIVIDERLAVLRSEPDLSATLLQRLSHGREVTVAGLRTASDGVTFYRVTVTRNTRGWMQAESLASARRAADDARLLRLARGSNGFEQIERARLHLELFPRSPARSQALLLLGDAASAAAANLTRGARRRINPAEMNANPAPAHSYMLNFRDLDRYAREGVRFAYDSAANRYVYDGAAWREIVRRHAQTPEAAEARRRLDALAAAQGASPAVSPVTPAIVVPR